MDKTTLMMGLKIGIGEGTITKQDILQEIFGHTTPPMEPERRPGVKMDGGKPPVYRGVIVYWPRALGRLAEISAAGTAEPGHVWGGWKSVPNGFTRYSDAMCRHQLEEARIEMPKDPDGFEKAVGAVAWNAMSRYEHLLLDLED